MIEGGEREMVKEGEGADGKRRKDGAGGEREGAKARSCNDRPPDYIGAQINRPCAGSLESSCGAGEESFHFRGLRSSKASDGMGFFSHLHQLFDEQGSRVTSHLRSLLITRPLLRVQTAYKVSTRIIQLTISGGAASVEKRRERMLDICAF